jgi:glycosyltransferase involved in cell wall biosynthesis
MNILFLSGRELEYPRNSLIHRFLSKDHSVRFVGQRSRKASIFWQSIRSTLIGLPVLMSGRYDLCYTGFFGQLLLLPLGLVHHQRFLLDAFISAYDTLCFDRQVIASGSVLGRLAHWLDHTACQRATHILVDTQAHADYFQREFNLASGKMDVLFVGCDDELFQPMDIQPEPQRVLFYGSYLPLHGLEYILGAAEIIEKARPGVSFHLIGPDLGKVRNLNITRWSNLKNVAWRLPVPLSHLPYEIQKATICLGGHFGNSAKAGRVIAGKTFQCLAMGKPTIVGDNAANRELLEPGRDALFSPMGNSTALAENILGLLDQPELCRLLGENGRAAYLARASNVVLQEKLNAILLHMAD